MGTLMLRLAGPLQAWGADSKFEVRRTGPMPTKSGVVGLLAAALGRRRDADLEDLCQLRFGVRIDQEGHLLRDLHTARKDEKTSYLTQRYYLEDAVFLVGLESEDEDFLFALNNALQKPAHPLFLGRRACPPLPPLPLGIRSAPLLDALRAEPWLVPEWRKRSLHGELPIYMDAAENQKNAAPVQDVPVSFDPHHRRYRFRTAVACGTVCVEQNRETAQHDAMAELR